MHLQEAQGIECISDFLKKYFPTRTSASLSLEVVLLEAVWAQVRDS